VRKAQRRAGLAAAVMGVLVLGAGPAQAVADVNATTADGPVPWALTAECTPAAGYATDASEVHFVIKATAHGEGAAIGTQVACTVYKDDGTQVGSCSNALIGPASACTATVDVPVGEVPRICVSASALYATGVAQLPTCPERL
jgi:hypothetical protein